MEQRQIHKVRAPEVYGDFWFNSDPLTVRALQGQVILLCFWDYTSERSLRMLQVVQEWARRYQEMGLVAIGIHSPEFSFARDPKYVEGALHRLGIRMPVATDNTLMTRDAYRVQELPTLFLVEREGSIYLSHSEEGGYERIERSIQTLLRDAGFRGELPLLMEAHDEFVPPSFQKLTPPIRTGYLHGSLGNVEGYSPELPSEYDDAHLYIEGKFYAQGTWLAKSESFDFEGEADHGYVAFRYSGNGVNVVMSAKKEGAVVRVLQNGKAVAPQDCGEDLTIDDAGNSFFVVRQPGLFRVVRNKEFSDHTLTIIPQDKGTTLYSISFGVPPGSLLGTLGKQSYRNN